MVKKWKKLRRRTWSISVDTRDEKKEETHEWDKRRKRKGKRETIVREWQSRPKSGVNVTVYRSLLDLFILRLKSGPFPRLSCVRSLLVYFLSISLYTKKSKTSNLYFCPKLPEGTSLYVFNLLLIWNVWFGFFVPNIRQT